MNDSCLLYVVRDQHCSDHVRQAAYWLALVFQGI